MMQMSFRWYGKEDPVSLEKIRQIPQMEGIVSSLYDVPVGEVWSLEKIKSLKEEIEASGLTLSVIESVPVHEDIKLGRASRETFIENYKQTIRNLGEAGIRTVCYNFMPVFDWTRTDLDYALPDGSTGLRYDQSEIDNLDISSQILSLPGWDVSYRPEEMKSLIEAYQKMSHEELWKNLEYFLQEIIPVAIEADVKMGIHPDDPPWDIFGLPRIITNKEALERLVSIYDSSYNGLTFCTGSFGSSPDNHLKEMLEYVLKEKRVNFVHARNVALIEGNSFQEVAHASSYGNVDMYDIISTLVKYDYKGPIRPDHGRMIWGETGKPGYGLYDRALGATYLKGLEEAIVRGSKG